MFFHFFSRSWSELTDIRLNRVRVDKVKLYIQRAVIPTAHVKKTESLHSMQGIEDTAPTKK